MHLKKLFLPFALIFIISLCSCELFSSTKLSSSEIKKASSWSSKDQPPSFPECEGVEKKNQLKCFQSIISNQLTLAISDIDIIAIDMVVLLVIASEVVRRQEMKELLRVSVDEKSFM